MPFSPARARARSSIAGVASMPVACLTCGAKAQTTMPPPQARSRSVSSGPGRAASMISFKAASFAIGAAVENGVAWRVNWSRIRSWCAASVIWTEPLSFGVRLPVAATGCPTASGAEDRLEVLGRQGVANPGEAALVLHLAGAPHEGGERETRQRPADAQPLDPDRFHFGGGERGIGGAHHHIERLAARLHYDAHGGEIAQPGRIEHIRPGLLERLQAPNGVVEVGPAADQVLGPGDEGERDRQGAGHFERGRYPRDRAIEIVNALAAPILDRAADAPRLA